MGNIPLQRGQDTMSPTRAQPFPSVEESCEQVMTLPPWSVLSPMTIRAFMVASGIPAYKTIPSVSGELTIYGRAASTSLFLIPSSKL
jgi:hypothetical protein